jgi:hypothetical protein
MRTSISRKAASKTDEIGQLGAECSKAGELIECCQAGKPGMIRRTSKRRAPEGHDSIADILVDDAIIMPYPLGHHGHIAVQHIDQPDRRHSLTEGSEALHIAKQDSHFAPRAFGVGQLGPVEQPGDNPRIDVFAEGIPDLCLGPQLADHAVERPGQ